MDAHCHPYLQAFPRQPTSPAAHLLLLDYMLLCLRNKLPSKVRLCLSSPLLSSISSPNRVRRRRRRRQAAGIVVVSDLEDPSLGRCICKGLTSTDTISDLDPFEVSVHTTAFIAMAKPWTTSMLLVSKALVILLTFGAIQCYSTSSSKKKLRTSAPDTSSFAVWLQFALSFIEFLAQAVGQCIGFGPLPVDPVYCFLLMITDAGVALFTSGATASVLGAIVFLNDHRLINEFYHELLWHGALGLAGGTFGFLGAILNLVAAKQDA